MKLAALVRGMGGTKAMMEAFKSRKFWAAVLAGAVAAGGPYLHLTPEQIHWLVGAVGTYVIGQGISDSGKDDASKH